MSLGGRKRSIPSRMRMVPRFVPRVRLNGARNTAAFSASVGTPVSAPTGPPRDAKGAIVVVIHAIEIEPHDRLSERMNKREVQKLGAIVLAGALITD
jgi:hypothetical protein